MLHRGYDLQANQTGTYVQDIYDLEKKKKKNMNLF